MNNISVNPQTEAIKAEIEVLRKEFLKLYTQKDEMITIERDDIYYRYVDIIGKEQYENYKLSVELKAMKFKVELAQASINRKERPNILKIETQVNKQLKQYYDIVREQADAVKMAQKSVLISKDDVKEMHDLFRIIVKRLHPDLHPNQLDKMSDLFIKGQTAYRTHNLALLREIIMKLDMDGNIDEIIEREETLTEMRDRLKTQIEMIKHDIKMLNESFPFRFRQQLKDEKWINEKKEEMKRERELMEAELKMFTDMYTLMTED
jgi:hypothetical protein